jgi:hypothetical protein
MYILAMQMIPYARIKIDLVMIYSWDFLDPIAIPIYWFSWTMCTILNNSTSYICVNRLHNCQYPSNRVPLHTSFKSKQVAGRASTRCHVPYGSGPRFPAKVGFGATTCPTAPDLTSRLRCAPTLSCVLWLRTSPPGWGGLRHYHVSFGFGPRVSTEVGSDAATCHAVPWGPQASSIKKT